MDQSRRPGPTRGFVRAESSYACEHACESVFTPPQTFEFLAATAQRVATFQQYVVLTMLTMLTIL